MERLWTPWRMPYVAGARDQAAGECFFCQALGGTDDAASLLLSRGKQALVMLNLYPYNTAHLMVAPLAHVAEPTHLSAKAWRGMWDATQQALKALEREYRPDGFNVGMNLGRVAGAGLPEHLHVHVVPRWDGDSNFMPVVAGAKVMPETLAETYRRLKPLFG